MRRARRALAALAPLAAFVVAGCAPAPSPPPAPAGPEPPATEPPPDRPGPRPEDPGLGLLIEPAPIERAQAPPPGPYAPGFDALHYDIALTLPDSGSLIRGRATVRVARTPGAAGARDTLALDLTGLAVEAVGAGWVAPASGGGTPVGIGRVPFSQRAGKLLIDVSGASADTLSVVVFYAGHPDDGLIIGPNVHGERGVFADNWPNRARYWFPSIDHPSDKATVSFAVRAPPRWDVIANGALLPRPPAGREPAPPPALPAGPDPEYAATWHWGTDVPIPTYLMVIAAADMEHIELGQACGVAADEAACVEVTGWSFPQDVANAAAVFRRAPEMLRYYADLIGPFQYEKLAHVQSATMFGGMENASAIFYSDDAIAAGRLGEGVVAHETAHQWFGDAVTEADWRHLWLSEGFASYFGALFFQHADGDDRFRAIMREEAEGYFDSQVVDQPVIVADATNLLALLNANNYNKGAWVLHMLRGLIGDEAFFDAARRYYHAHLNGTALTDDFERAAEAASGRQLDWFFQQWLREPGYPRLAIDWRWDDAAGVVIVEIEQRQPADWPTFRASLTLVFRTAGGDERRVTAQLDARAQTFRFELPSRPTDMVVDPDGWLLHQRVATGP